MRKRTHLYLTVILLAAAFFPMSIKASERDEISETEKTDTSMSRPVTGVYSIEIGGIQVLATYLSPLKYSGKRIGVSGRWSKAMPFNPGSAVMEFRGGGGFSDMLNPAKTARMLGIEGSFSWGMSWRKRFANNFQITAGGALKIEGGAYYLLRNGNNPVEAIGNFSLDIRGSISKSFTIGKLPILLSDQIDLPSLGVFFNPDYGETYYEIYLGNRHGLVHAGWWGNNFRIDNLLSFTLDFGRTAMEVGYRFTANTQWANNLNTKIFTNSIVLGVIPGGIGLKKQPKRLPETTVYAIY